MLDQICAEIKNYFVVARYFGVFTIADGDIDLSELTTDNSLQQGQYFRIVGSVFNDGVYKYGEELNLTDEVFDGAIWTMAVPKELEELAGEIAQWIIDNQGALNSPYQSESFGGYSYSLKGSGLSGNAKSSNNITWQSQFSNRYNRWRKMSCLY